ncbi:topogenesis of outer membrane beta barrel proteins 38 [Diaporthe helianthi]|uniref:Topogenesis of outer membrane beta barrel proteins 38 n=1 Tax=Diaporthe helianthi TaxID=158607 RepID=A0A2P5I779_DIAHE|nr:topogenesis of outer membrane beta barrel proteins 38 [Diaporthe helianthi]
MTDSTSASASSGRSWVPPVPGPLQRLFDAVPLVTYGPNELPLRSPGASELPTLHVFITEHDAARGAPSFNPSCLKWQTFLRIAGVKFHLRPSTNHASPTGALPFLLPPLSTITPTTTTPKTTPTTTDKYARLDGKSTQPIPSSRLEAYAAQHGALPPPSITNEAPTPQLQSQSRRRQAYQTLLDGPLRTAWLYNLYLSPANEPLLRRWYVDPASRSQLVRDALLRRVRAVARDEVAKSSEGTSVDGGKVGGWKLSGNVGDLLSWALAGTPAIDPDRIYADARRALGALETLLYAGAEGEADQQQQQPGDGSGWFFDAPHPTLFDTAVFSYVYLILNGARASSSGGSEKSRRQDGETWGDDTLRRIVLECPRLVAHARRIVDSYWGDLDDGEWVSLEH